MVWCTSVVYFGGVLRVYIWCTSGVLWVYFWCTLGVLRWCASVVYFGCTSGALRVHSWRAAAGLARPAWSHLATFGHAPSLGVLPHHLKLEGCCPRLRLHVLLALSPATNGSFLAKSR
eukprot:7505477-Pyramimonas_sp.AAC.1